MIIKALRVSGGSWQLNKIRFFFSSLHETHYRSTWKATRSGTHELWIAGGRTGGSNFIKGNSQMPWRSICIK